MTLIIQRSVENLAAGVSAKRWMSDLFKECADTKQKVGNQWKPSVPYSINIIAHIKRGGPVVCAIGFGRCNEDPCRSLIKIENEIIGVEDRNPEFLEFGGRKIPPVER